MAERTPATPRRQSAGGDDFVATEPTDSFNFTEQDVTGMTAPVGTAFGSGTRGQDDAGGATPTVGEQVQEVAEQVQESAGQLIGQVRTQASTQLTTQKDRAAEGLGVVAQALRQTGEQVRAQDQAMVAQYLDGIAGQAERLSDQLRSQDLGQLAEATERFARRRPEVFVGAALAVGFLASRFFRSSGQQQGAESQYRAGTAERPPYDVDRYAFGYAGTSPSPSFGYGTATDLAPAPRLSDAMTEARATGRPLTSADYLAGPEEL